MYLWDILFIGSKLEVTLLVSIDPRFMFTFINCNDAMYYSCPVFAEFPAIQVVPNVYRHRSWADYDTIALFIQYQLVDYLLVCDIQEKQRLRSFPLIV